MFGCPDLYPSDCEDWIDPRSILGVIVVMHGEIGELSRGSRTHAKLLDDSIFFTMPNIYKMDAMGGYYLLLYHALTPQSGHYQTWELVKLFVQNYVKTSKHQ